LKSNFQNDNNEDKDLLQKKNKVLPKSKTTKTPIKNAIRSVMKLPEVKRTGKSEKRGVPTPKKTVFKKTTSKSIENSGKSSNYLSKTTPEVEIKEIIINKDILTLDDDNPDYDEYTLDIDEDTLEKQPEKKVIKNKEEKDPIIVNYGNFNVEALQNLK